MSPRIIVCHGWKYEPESLVEELHENLAWVDGFAVVDCRERTDELWIDERELYRLQRQKAKELGADWLIVTAPDERWDRTAEATIREAIENAHKEMFKIRVLEMYTPTAYRSDGMWARRGQTRIFPLLDNATYSTKSLHNPICPLSPKLKKTVLDVNCYHLKHIEPENRNVRRKVFEKLDPKHVFQTIGYKYLDDNRRIELTEITQGREFLPPYTQKYLFNPPEKLYDA